MEAHPQLQQRRHPALHLEAPLARLGGAHDQLEQGRLAGPVLAHDPHRLARCHLEAHLLQGPQLPVPVVAAGAQPLGQPPPVGGVALVLLAQAAGPDRAAHSSSTISPERRRKEKRPRARKSAATASGKSSSPHSGQALRSTISW